MTCAQGLLRLLWGGGPKLECYGTVSISLRRKMYIHCVSARVLIASLQLDWATTTGRLLGPATFLLHEDGGISPKDTTSKLADLFSTLSLFLCQAPSREAVNIIFKVFWYDSTREMNTRSTACGGSNPVACRGLVMPGANCLIVCLPPNLSSTLGCDKNRHLKYVKASVEKKISKD